MGWTFLRETLAYGLNANRVDRFGMDELDRYISQIGLSRENLCDGLHISSCHRTSCWENCALFPSWLGCEKVVPAKKLLHVKRA